VLLLLLLLLLIRVLVVEVVNRSLGRTAHLQRNTCKASRGVNGVFVRNYRGGTRRRGVCVCGGWAAKGTRHNHNTRVPLFFFCCLEGRGVEIQGESGWVSFREGEGCRRQRRVVGGGGTRL